MNLGKKLRPAKRAWKIFTTTIHTKFRRLSASKSIKKSKTHIKTTNKASSTAIFQSRVNNPRKKIHKTRIFFRHRLPKRPAPVYIDELFNGSVVTSKELVKEICSTSSGKKEKVVGVEEGASGADDMWESLQVASPLMYGIDERADEFIARIKAEMQLQEMMARRL